MSTIEPVPENGGAGFFGFMGVSMALVLASSSFLTQTSEQHTEPQKQEPASAAFPSGDPQSSWNRLFLSSWLVFWVSTVWLWLSLSVKEVSIFPLSQIQWRIHLQKRFLAYGLRSRLRIQLHCISLFTQAAGYSIGKVGDAGIRANAQQERLFVGLILILIFGEALALYGLIVSLILISWSSIR